MKIRRAALTAAFTFVTALCHGQGIITTVAGTATCCNSTDGRAATATWLTALGSITLDKQGNLYIWEGASFKVRKVNTSGTVSTVAGNGNFGYTGDGGPATSATLFATQHSGLAFDGAGNLYLSDGQNQVIRKVDTAGIITTVAGNGTAGFSGDGGPATKAQLQYPEGIAVDSAGNLYIADRSNSRVRKVDTSGIISTYAGNGNVVYSGDGVQANTTAVHEPQGLAVDSTGNLYISETGDSRVRKVNASGIISTIAGQTKKTSGFAGDGGPATAALLSGGLGLAVDASGNLYIADNGNSRIRKVDAAGIITTVAGINGNASTPIGDGGPSTSAFIGVPQDVAPDATGNLYIGGAAGGVVRVRKVTQAATFTASPNSLAFSFTIGGQTPAAQSVSVNLAGAPAAFTATASSTGNWLSVTPSSATTPATLNVSVNPAGLPGGSYQGGITLSGGGASLAFSVTLTVTGAGSPAFTSSSVYNALGYQTKLAPGAVFVIFGSAMGPASIAFGGPDYPASLAGTSITFTPAGGAAINARIVYTVAGQVAGLLPSSIAPGTYGVRVSYNSLTSAPQNVTVVARSFGIATVNSAGTGTAQATIGNVNSGVSLTRFTTGSVAFNGLTWTLSPAHPNDTLVLWGTGGGSDPANDAGGTSGDQTAAGSFSVLVNGRAITPLYAGASQGFPGLWQINFTLPGDIAPDCFAPVQVSAGGELSNAVTIPIAAAGQSACSDPQLSPDALGRLDAGGTIALGGFSVAKITATSSLSTSPGGTPTVTTISQETASGVVGLYNATEYAALFSGLKIGPCTIMDRTGPATAKNPAAPDGYLDAGARLPISGPGIAAGAALGIISPGPIYGMAVANGTLTAGGRYTITAPGGTGLGPFTASTTLASTFTVTGWDSLNTISRSQPLTLSWTGSGLDQIAIIGSTSAVLGKDDTNTNIIHTVSFTCQVPAAPGSYTIPASVLSHLLPATTVASQQASGTGGLSVESLNSTPFTSTLVSGGQAVTAMSAILGYSRNLAVQ
jgi:uncharacterized protein (TIGR03437 family)